MTYWWSGPEGFPYYKNSWKNWIPISIISSSHFLLILSGFPFWICGWTKTLKVRSPQLYIEKAQKEIKSYSFHPVPLVRSIPLVSIFRLRRNCSSEQQFKAESRLLRNRLFQRGYSKTSLGKAYIRVKDQERSQLISIRNLNQMSLLASLQNIIRTITVFMIFFPDTGTSY